MQLLDKLTDSYAQKKVQNAFISEDLCHDFKISRQGRLSKYKERSSITEQFASEELN